MKILVTGDLHIDASTAGVPRAYDVQDALGQVVERVQTVGIDLVIVLGDLCNPDRGSRTIHALGIMRQFLDAVQPHAAVLAISGNHDVVADDSALTSWTPLQHYGPGYIPTDGMLRLRDLDTREFYAVENVPTLVTFTPPPSVGVVHMLCLPFAAQPLAYRPDLAVAEASHFDLHGRKLLVAGHLQLEGALLGSETTDMPRGREVAFPAKECRELLPESTILLNGHYHKRQTVGGVECPGSLVRLAFGEEHNSPRWIELEV